jgi:hypothetical protein
MATFDLADELRNVIKLCAPFREQFGTIHGNNESFEFALSKEIWHTIESSSVNVLNAHFGGTIPSKSKPAQSP